MKKIYKPLITEVEHKILKLISIIVICLLSTTISFALIYIPTKLLIRPDSEWLGGFFLPLFLFPIVYIINIVVTLLNFGKDKGSISKFFFGKLLFVYLLASFIGIPIAIWIGHGWDKGASLLNSFTEALSGQNLYLMTTVVIAIFLHVLIYSSLNNYLLSKPELR